MANEKEIRRYQTEIESLISRRKIFLGFGIPLLVIGILLLIASIVFFSIVITITIDTQETNAGLIVAASMFLNFGLIFGILMVVGGIALIVLQGTLLLSKINKRKILIDELE